MSLGAPAKSDSLVTLNFTIAGNNRRWNMVFCSTEHYILSRATNC